MEEVYVERVESLVNYIEIHLISLEQDLEELSERMDSIDPASKYFDELDFEYNIKSGEITATRHLLSVVNDRMVTWKREKNNV